MSVDWSVGLAEWIDEIRNKVFFGSFFADDVFFVFYDDFVIGDFNDFATGDGKLGVREAFDERATDDNLLNAEIVASGSEINDATKLGAFLSLNFHTDKAEIKFNDFADFDNIGGRDKLVG